MRPDITAAHPKGDRDPFYNAAQRRARIIAEATRLGIAIIPIGTAFHIRGRGIDIKTTDLAAVTVEELRI